jgi:hypothetical protein
MKHKTLLSSLVVAFLLMTAFGVANVYTATSCFTDTTGLKASVNKAICWMQANHLASGSKFNPNDATTRAQAAVWLQKASQIPPSTGDIRISAGLANWRPFVSTDNLTFNYFANLTSVTKATVGSNYLSIHPSIPAVLYGRSLQLLGVEFCYSASASAALASVEIHTYTHTTGPSINAMHFFDNTVRTDSACQHYVLPTPVTLTAEDGVNFFIRGNWTFANAPFDIGRTTFVFKPTDVKATSPLAASGKDAILLQESGPVPDGGPTDRH